MPIVLEVIACKQTSKQIRRGIMSYVDNEEFFLRFSDVSTSANFNGEFPGALLLPLNVYLAPSWVKMFDVNGDGGVNKAKEVLSDVKVMFIHPSLETKFIIEYNEADIFSTSVELEATRRDLADLVNYIEAPIYSLPHCSTK